MKDGPTTSRTTADADGEWCKPETVELQWVHRETGEILGHCVDGHVPARAAWVGRYGDRWVELFEPGSVNYARPN